MRKQFFNAIREMQNRFLPHVFSLVPRLDYYGASRTSGPVGADFFDFIPLANRSLSVALGGVSEKTMAAAMLQAAMQGSLRHLAAMPTASLAFTVKALNRLVCDLSSQHLYATLFYAQVDPAARSMRYVNAGNEAALLVRASGRRVQVLEGTGTVLGLCARSNYTERTVTIEPGDLLVTVSDGVTGAKNEHAVDFSMAGVAEAVLEHEGEEANELVEAILTSVERFTNFRGHSEDRTVLAAKLMGTAAAGVAIREEVALVCAAG